MKGMTKKKEFLIVDPTGSPLMYHHRTFSIRQALREEEIGSIDVAEMNQTIVSGDFVGLLVSLRGG